MPAGFTPENLSSPWILVGLVFCLVMFGALVPRWIHKAIVNDKNKEIEAWKSTAGKLVEQNSDLIGHSTTALHIGDEIKRLAERGGTG